MGFSREEYWSGKLFPSPGIFLSQGPNTDLWRCRQVLYCLSHQGSPSTKNEKKMNNTQWITISRWWLTSSTRLQALREAKLMRRARWKPGLSACDNFLAKDKVGKPHWAGNFLFFLILTGAFLSVSFYCFQRILRCPFSIVLTVLNPYFPSGLNWESFDCLQWETFVHFPWFKKKFPNKNSKALKIFQSILASKQTSKKEPLISNYLISKQTLIISQLLWKPYII